MSGQCESIVVFMADGYHQARRTWVRCIRDAGHDRDHWASWGGAAAWRQMSWTDEQSAVRADVPRGRKIRNDPRTTP